MMVQSKSQFLVHLEQKPDPYQDYNDIDVAHDLEIFLRSLHTSIFKMNDMEVLRVYLIFKRLPSLDTKFSSLTIYL